MSGIEISFEAREREIHVKDRRADGIHTFADADNRFKAPMNMPTLVSLTDVRWLICNALARHSKWVSIEGLLFGLQVTQCAQLETILIECVLPLHFGGIRSDKAWFQQWLQLHCGFTQILSRLYTGNSRRLLLMMQSTLCLEAHVLVWKMCFLVIP